MAHCLVGCCGWGEAKAKYFAHFPVVEVQTTFYEPPAPALASKWRALAPDAFQFCIKAWQLITHTPASPTYRRLKSQLSPQEKDSVGCFRPTEQVSLAWERTAAVAVALRASVVLFQCPASFRPDKENVNNLRSFFSRINRHEFTLAWEPRGEWSLDVVQGICKEFDLLHCVDPFKAKAVPGGGIYWRLHGRTGYSYRYTDQELAELSMMLQEAHECRGPAYVLFNNIWMKDDALRFQAGLATTSL